MNDITLQSLVRRNDDIVVGVIDGDVMMMSIESGSYYQLNIPASRIWALLEEPRTVAGLCESLLQQFKVDADTCERDVFRFVEDLAARNIVQVV